LLPDWRIFMNTQLVRRVTTDTPPPDRHNLPSAP
jgi:hypothetical protein